LEAVKKLQKFALLIINCKKSTKYSKSI